MHLYGTVHSMHVLLMHHERNSLRLSGHTVRLMNAVRYITKMV